MIVGRVCDVCRNALIKEEWVKPKVNLVPLNVEEIISVKRSHNVTLVCHFSDFCDFRHLKSHKCKKCHIYVKP